MKAILKLSIGLNLALATGLTVCLLAIRNSSILEMGPGIALQNPGKSSLPLHAPASIPSLEIKPFKWKELDANDYHGYVKNLRGVECPEPVIRAIVTADVHAAFRAYGWELETKLSGMQAGSWSTRLADHAAESALKDRLLQLPAEEQAKLEDILGYTTHAAENAQLVATRASDAPNDRTPSDAKAGQNTAGRNDASGYGGGFTPSLNGAPHLASKTVVKKESAVVQTDLTSDANSGDASRSPVDKSNPTSGPNQVALPFILQPLAPGEMSLSESQMQVISDLRQEFIDSVGGLNQNPDDPAYLKAWNKAQTEADLKLRGFLGISVYQAYQMVAWHHVNDPKAP